MPKRAKRKIAVIDLETDPFAYGQMINPFVAGFYDGDTFTSYWGDDCIERICKYLEAKEDPLIIFAHNGGRFDFFYFIERLHTTLRIVNGRIIQAHLGIHELRDSFAIMPFALATYKKTEIDYKKFTRENRDKHKDEILSYLRDDCTDLYDLCIAFMAEFGDKLTIGSAAMAELKKFHTFECGGKSYDAKFREHFYFGGRNQVFRAGIITGTINVYDVNSMYPFVMRDYLHPISARIDINTRITSKTTFVKVEGINRGAFPVRLKNNSLDFTQTDGIFHTTIHEYQAALDTGTFKTKRIIKTYECDRRESFDDFVNHFYDARKLARSVGDAIRTIFYKFVLNSGYGKFAQNPENYCDWYITPMGDFPPDWHECLKSCPEDCPQIWSPSFISGNGYIIWSRPLREYHYYNIATGASITGAARAVLLRGLSNAVDPYYCDTDSIICRSLNNVVFSDSELGAWKHEATGTMAAIAGKKLYAIYQGDKGIKKAHKGARLDYADIVRIAKGATVESCNPVPTFKWDGSHTFTKRNIKRTA